MATLQYPPGTNLLPNATPGLPSTLQLCRCLGHVGGPHVALHCPLSALSLLLAWLLVERRLWTRKHVFCSAKHRAVGCCALAAKCQYRASGRCFATARLRVRATSGPGLRLVGWLQFAPRVKCLRKATGGRYGNALMLLMLQRAQCGRVSAKLLRHQPGAGTRRVEAGGRYRATRRRGLRAGSHGRSDPTCW